MYTVGVGPVYTYSTGNRQHLYVNHPEMVKEMNQSTSLELGKPSYVTKTLAPMLGNGILRSNGNTWAHQRRIVAPEFFMDKVKVTLLTNTWFTSYFYPVWRDEDGMGRMKVRRVLHPKM